MHAQRKGSHSGIFNALFTKKESLMLSNKWEFFITTVDDHVTGIRVDIGAIQDEKFDRLIHTVLTCSLHQLL